MGEASVEVGKGDSHDCFTGGQLVLSKVFYCPSDSRNFTLILFFFVRALARLSTIQVLNGGVAFRFKIIMQLDIHSFMKYYKL